MPANSDNRTINKEIARRFIGGIVTEPRVCRLRTKSLGITITQISKRHIVPEQFPDRFDRSLAP